MLDQVFRQKLRFLSQGVRPLNITIVERSTRYFHVVIDLIDRLLLARAQVPVRQFLEVGICRRQQILTLLALPVGFVDRHPRDNLRCRFAYAATVYDNLARLFRGRRRFLNHVPAR